MPSDHAPYSIFSYSYWVWVNTRYLYFLAVLGLVGVVGAARFAGCVPSAAIITATAAPPSARFWPGGVIGAGRCCSRLLRSLVAFQRIGIASRSFTLPAGVHRVLPSTFPFLVAAPQGTTGERWHSIAPAGVVVKGCCALGGRRSFFPPVLRA